MKNQKGITLVSLVATVIVTIILAAVSTYAGLQAYTDAKVDAYVAKMKVIQSRVDIIAQQYNLWEGKKSTESNNFNSYIESLFEKAKEEYKERNAKIEGDSVVYPAESEIPDEYKNYKLPIIEDKGEKDNKTPHANNSTPAAQLTVEVVKKDNKNPINYYFFTPETIDTVLGVSTVKEDDLYIAVDFVNGIIYDSKGVKSPTDNLTHYNHYFLATYDTRIGDIVDNTVNVVDPTTATPVGTTQSTVEVIEPAVINNNDGTTVLEFALSNVNDNGEGITGIDYTHSEDEITDWGSVDWETTTEQENGKFKIVATEPGIYYAKEAGVGTVGEIVETVSAANKPKVPSDWSFVEIDDSGRICLPVKKEVAVQTQSSKAARRIIEPINILPNEPINDGQMYNYAKGKYANAMDKQGRVWVWIPRFYVDGGNIYFTSSTDTEKLEKKSTNTDSIKINKKLDIAFGNALGFWVEKIFDTSKLNAEFEHTNANGLKDGKLKEFLNSYTGFGSPNVMSQYQLLAIYILGEGHNTNKLPGSNRTISNFSLDENSNFSSNGNVSGVYCLKSDVGARVLSNEGSGFKIYTKGDPTEDIFIEDDTENQYYYRFVVLMEK